MRRRVHPGLGWLVLTWLAAGADCPALEPAQVVVVANQRLTNSVALARHYLSARGIPENNLVLVSLPEQETLARGVFETALRDPLLAVLRSRGLVEQVQRAASDVRPHETGWQTVKSSVRAVVCLRGVPLRIASTQHPWLVKAAHHLESPFYGDGAAVDSELSLLLADAYPLAGRVANPAYRHLRLAELGESAQKLLIATRLDAADDATVRRMIDDAVAVERTGLEGRAYFDLRAAREDGYALGDYWMEESAERLAREGVECVVDRHDGIFGPAYPMEAPVYYLGWYTEEVVGPFLRPDFRFARGAIAYHLHSASARSLRDPKRYWAAPLLAAGACATLGAVDEPLLGLTPDLLVLTDRLCRGLTFGESALLSLPGLSWQITVIGDPLYRPWAPERGGGGGEWGVIREVNRMVRLGRFNSALELLRRRLRDEPLPAWREKLGDLYAAGDLPREAGQAYQEAVRAAPSAPFAVRVSAKAQGALRAAGQREEALKLDAEVRARWAGHPCLQALETPRF